MNKQEYLKKYIDLCSSNLKENKRILALLKNLGIYENYILDNFNIGYSNGNLIDIIGDNKELISFFVSIGIIKNNKEEFINNLTIPIYDDNKAIINIAFYNPYPKSKNKLQVLNSKGIFNFSFLKNNSEIILTTSPINAFLLIQANYPNTTFLIGDDFKYVDFFKSNNIRKGVFTFDGKERLFFELTKNGVSTKRINISFDKLKTPDATSYLEELFKNTDTENFLSKDKIQEIENGFLFNLPHLSYRVIGNFTESSMRLKANIKAFTKDEVFMDSIELYKNRDRQNFIFNIMDKFNLRDQVQLENDLNQIIEVIENHIEKKANEKKKQKPELTEYQKDIGIKFLQNENLIDEITEDITKLGYVREDKNKIILYLIMTSRLLDNPLHSIIISRSGAGKSQLVDIVECLCPPEELESVSDLSAQALYYYGIDDLKNKFIVIGEKEGSKDSDYPLRQLITKKSIIKAIPMKDSVTGQIKTVTIKVNGPISLVETTTNGELNHENLNRCFVIAIDESEEQTRLIHHNQRIKYTLEGHLNKKELNKIREKHIYAQRLLKKIHVFNPYATLLTFPSQRLQTRRDNEKLLKLINVIAFLHQYQRKPKKMKLENNEVLEYIECTSGDYRIAYELLKDGLLDNTLDDLPRPARELLELIKKYIKEKSKQNDIPIDKIIFERKDIREYTSWSFAQVRNNIRILKDYEYLIIIKSKTGLAYQYKLASNYSELDFLNTILTPEKLEEKIKEQKFLQTA
ncbi:MAG: hypothetical protein ACFFDH_22405 [Promethearchaeota archaeon]